MGTIADLKTRLADVPGIENLVMRFDPASRRAVFEFGGLVASTDPLATDQEIDTAIRNATRVPSVALIPDKPQEVKPMSVTGAKYAAGSFSAKLREVREKMAAGSAKMDGALAKMDQAAEAHNAMADTVASEADALLAELGQFSNGGE